LVGIAVAMDRLLAQICGRRRPVADAAAAPKSRVDPDQWRFDLVRSVGEECQAERELWGVLRRTRKFFKRDFICYDGFEPSGRMHIAQGVFKAVNVNKCTSAGGVFIFWVADWFALMNDKMGGDLEKIKTVGQYFIEVWKATGMDMSKVEFRWSSDDINNNASEYWGQSLDIARKTTLARVKKCCQIMGRSEEKLTAAQIMYPVMQATDIFFLKADICQLGVDQRKVNMLARDYCDIVGRRKPVVLSHHMLYGLAQGQAKMSKSNPDSAIFMEDTPEDVERKIRKAYCPRVPEAAARSSDVEAMQLVQDELMNPCLDYLQHILFGQPDYTFSANGKAYTRYEDAKAAFLSGEISETTLKDRLIEEINKLLDPVRAHFASDPFAKDLLTKITEWKKDSAAASTTVTKLALRPPLLGDAFVIFAPLPQDFVRLEAVLGTVARLRAAPEGAERILWLEDWTAAALDHVGADEGRIRGYYELLLHGLRGVAPELMESTRVCWQGEAILAGPSEYWISVINAGRRTTLEQIRAALPAGESLEFAGQVFASLMHMADVLALSAASVVLCCDRPHEGAHRLAAQHCGACGLVAPEVRVMDDSSRLRLLPEGQGKTEADVQLLLTDDQDSVCKKIGKAYCMPSKADFCPPLAWASELLPLSGGQLEVRRSAANGGDRVYRDFEELRAEFVEGALHPGDLKPAVGAAANALLEPLRRGLDMAPFAKGASKS